MSCKRRSQRLLSVVKKNDYHAYVEVQDLLARECDLECADGKGRTALHWATKHGCVNIAQLLVAQGAGVETEDIYGNTPLSTAASCGDLELTSLYLEQGAKPDGTNRLSIPLINAAGFGNREVAALLLEHGANVDVVNNEGETPLIYATMKGRFFTVKLLLEKGASTRAAPQVDVSNEHSSQRTALHWAVQEGYLEIAQLLVAHGADVEAEDESGITPLSSAAAIGAMAMTALFLQTTVNINGTKTSQSPLMLAVAFQYYPVVELLISHGADVNFVEDDGDSALLLAVKNRNLNIIKLLLDHGADENRRNEDGQTALTVAKASGKKRLISLLKSSKKS